MALKVQPSIEAVQATINGQDSFGLSVGTTANGGHLTAGWHSERRVIVSPTNSSVRVEWPSCDFFNLRVGSRPPFEQVTDNPTASPPNR